MQSAFFNLQSNKFILLSGILATFVVTMLLIKYFSKRLPSDRGKAYAVGGEYAKGKPNGAGVIIIPCFAVMRLIIMPVDLEGLIYCGLAIVAMISGFLDDKAAIPWSDYKKGLIDLIIAAATMIAFVWLNPESIGFQFFGGFVFLPKIVFIIMGIILLWVSINVTNCVDGVDGLCGVLSIITLASLYFMQMGDNGYHSGSILILIACISGYLWFNISPSKLLMGDAGSRAIGFFIGVMALKTYNPFMYLLVAFMLWVDGGIGLFKIFLIRFFKVHIMKNIRAPIHDYARKTLGWSDPQVVYRFAAIQIIVSCIALLSDGF